MKSAMGARPEGLMLSCTTSGYINESIYDELIKRSTRFLLGDSKEQRLLPLLYIIDSLEAWNDINELRKSNPNLGVSVTADYLTEEIAIAEGSRSKKAEFLTESTAISNRTPHRRGFPLRWWKQRVVRRFLWKTSVEVTA